MTGVWVFGASGYSGMELCRWLARHPSRLLGVSGAKSAGTPLLELVPDAGVDLEIAHHADLLRQAEAGQVAFLATPAETSMQLAEPLWARGVWVIDLSGAFRLPASVYPEWYGFEHTAPHLLDEAHYGLCEWMPPSAPAEGGRRLVANPGCYATAATLAVAPLVREGLIRGPIFVDGKSGTTGAGKKAAEHLLFSEAAESLGPYRVGRHQHTPEIERALAVLSGRSWTVQFVPHLVPQRRGLLTTAYAAAHEGTTQAEVDAAFARAYGGHPLVEIRDPDRLATGRYRERPGCGVGARFDPRTGSVVAVGALDNLLKGAASQALQNLNHLWGLPAETGLWKSAR